MRLIKTKRWGWIHVDRLGIRYHTPRRGGWTGAATRYWQWPW